MAVKCLARKCPRKESCKHYRVKNGIESFDDYSCDVLTNKATCGPKHDYKYFEPYEELNVFAPPNPSQIVEYYNSFITAEREIRKRLNEGYKVVTMAGGSHGEGRTYGGDVLVIFEKEK